MRFPKFRFSKLPRWLTAPWLRIAGLLILLLVAAYALYLDFRVRDEFEGRRFALPAHVYARPLELHVGLRIPAGALDQELRLLGYRDAGAAEGGWYSRAGDRFEIATRAFVLWDGPQPAQRLRVEFAGGQLVALQDADGKDVALARLEPLLIGGIYPAHNEDRVLVKLDEVPPHLVQALTSMEDRKFYSHIGVDPRGLARAVVNTLRGEVQGGSTLTQQLVKNFFLTRERTLARKFTELIMAVLLELHYDKDEILQTYLNEIYLGQDRNRAIHGVGLAAHFYFGKPVQELTLPEAALLVGMIKGPSFYDPHRHAQRALERRNLVLQEMKNLDVISMERYAAARATALNVNPKPSMGTSPHPAFLELVRRQLRRDYAEDDLRSEGLRIFTTLDPRVQAVAERALSRRLAELDKKGAELPLEGAAIVTHSQNGEVQAMVGGRDVRFQGYNRALDAARPVGSLMKPVIYLTALNQSPRYTLVTPIDDGPFVWKSRGAKNWEPANYDKQHHGKVALRMALANSYNVASARLGTTLGIDAVLDNARKLGIERELPPYASTMLGAIDLTPYEVTQMYQTLASGGFRTPPRAIREVLTKDDKPLQRYSLSVQQVFEPAPVYLLTTALQDVVRVGTAQGLRNWVPAETAVAGKTGTTDDLRDSWFAGFTGDRLAVVWIGYDDNRPTRLTGASGAMTIWGELMGALDPEPLVLPLPENIERVWIDPSNGLLADKGCADALELPFTKDSAPTEQSPCATSSTGMKGWLRRLFGK
ncbi:MAG TPA: penicillin-binding protein 1B [Burkholderiaceae bacterium]|nr:penicillin-binding protein 1B [Burkholderiaceae bacterium]